MTNSRFFAIAVLLTLASSSAAWAKLAALQNATTTSAERARANAALPYFNVEPGCRAAIQAGALLPGRTESACMHDEKDARSTLVKEWNQFDTGEKSLCLALENDGGPPSYVELLTCLEMGKDVTQLPEDMLGPSSGPIEQRLPHVKRRAQRRPSETTGSAPSK